MGRASPFVAAPGGVRLVQVRCTLVQALCKPGAHWAQIHCKNRTTAFGTVRLPGALGLQRQRPVPGRDV